MAFQVSPGINVSEVDLTTIVPAVATTSGAIGGLFRWGPVGQLVLVDSEITLTHRFGKPTNFNAETFFTAANFLAYGNSLYVSRAANTIDTSVNGAWSAIADASNSIAGNTQYAGTNVNTVFFVQNADDYNNKSTLGDFSVNTNYKWIAKYPGAIGSSLAISTVDTAAGFSSNLVNVSSVSLTPISNSGSINFTDSIATINAATNAANLASYTAWSTISVGDYITVGNATIGTQNLQVSSKGNTPAFYSQSLVTLNSNTIITNITNTASIVVGMTVVANVAANINLATVTNIVNSSAVAISNPANTTTAATVKFAQETLNLSFYNNYTLSTSWTPSTTNVGRLWQFYDSVSAAPGTSQYVTSYGNTVAVDEIHVVVTDALGQFTGVPGQVLEVYQNLSRATDAKTPDGSTNYYVNVINQNSQYVWFANHRQSSGYVANAALITSQSDNIPETIQFAGGQDGFDETSIAPNIGVISSAYDLFKSTETAPISLLMTGKSDDAGVLPNYLIQNIALPRMDCVVFVSPKRSSVINNIGNEAFEIIAFRNSLTSSSYGVLDSGYKYQYDKYNDLYRYVPLNGDIAGLCVFTDTTKDPWWSPAGFNRGQIKNVVKLAYNPKKTERDALYPVNVNPVVTFPGQGTILFGDKTLQAKPSAFDRINVRRLFIVLEKAISAAAQYSLFEFNDAFTRSQFVSLVTPFLLDVQGRQGIYDFKVVCDETNNTPQVIDANQFVGDIYVKPARSINFIQLNFVAVRTGVEFSEIVGKF
jgi:Phage tail sheath protein subtilisin-like domain/Phage tail sheath C-terminal domain